jgi:predicted MFS family arabinose efflux permease
MIWALLAGGVVNRLMERVPAGDRPAHMAWHNMALNLGILVGSMLGPLLGEWLGVRNAILSTAFLRMIPGFMFLLWG